MDRRRNGGGRIRIGYFSKYSPSDGCLDNAVAVCMPVVLHIILFFFIFCYFMIANQTEGYYFFMNSSRVLPIQQKFWSEVSYILRAQWNGTDLTQATARLVIVLVSRIQKSGTRDNNFVPGQIFLSGRSEMVRSIWFLTEISKILDWMESAPSKSTNLVSVVSFLCYFYFASPASFHYRA